MECPYKECSEHEDCGILEITQKIPKTVTSCSYCTPYKKNKDKGTEHGSDKLSPK